MPNGLNAVSNADALRVRPIAMTARSLWLARLNGRTSEDTIVESRRRAPKDCRHLCDAAGQMQRDTGTASDARNQLDRALMQLSDAEDQGQP